MSSGQSDTDSDNKPHIVANANQYKLNFTLSLRQSNGNRLTQSNVIGLTEPNVIGLADTIFVSFAISFAISFTLRYGISISKSDDDRFWNANPNRHRNRNSDTYWYRNGDPHSHGHSHVLSDPDGNVHLGHGYADPLRKSSKSFTLK